MLSTIIQLRCTWVWRETCGGKISDHSTPNLWTQDVFQTSYVCSFYIQCPEGSDKFFIFWTVTANGKSLHSLAYSFHSLTNTERKTLTINSSKGNIFFSFRDEVFLPYGQSTTHRFTIHTTIYFQHISLKSAIVNPANMQTW